VLSLTKAWQCDIWPHLLRLRLGDRLVAVQTRSDDESLEVALTALLTQRPSSLPWRDSVTFHLDTDDLMFMVQPWQPGVATPQELLRLSQLQASGLRQRDGWEVRFESAGWQQPALVACLQQPCWTLLRTLANRQRLRFHGVATPFQPLLQLCQGKLPEQGLFVTIGSHHSRIASRVDHAWQEVSTLSLPRQEIRSQLQIIARLSGMADCPQYVVNTDDRQPRVITPHEAQA
jgi:hypothetical protein